MKFWFLPFILVLASCSGLRGKADDLYEKGAYIEAVQMYQAALQEHPNDQDALAGLKKARTSYIDKRLIEVRKARLASNRQLALDILVELVKNEAEWSFYPGGAIANTQEEESIEAVKFVEFTVNESITKDRPLWGLYWLSHYQPVFSGGLAGRREHVLRNLSKTGQKQCEGLSRLESAKQPYFSEFVRKVCTAWGVSDKGKLAGINAKRSELYKGITVQPAMAGFPQAYRSALNTALERAFEGTPWFDPEGGRTLTVRLTGEYNLDHSRIRERRVHGYSVSIPYTDYQNVTKYRNVPYTVYEDDCQYDSVTHKRICNSRPVTRYRSESYQEREPVTKHRSVPKTQEYDGIQHHQTLEWRAAGELTLGKLTRPLRLDAQSTREGFEHNWNLPDIGLYPSKPKLENPEDWVTHQSNLLGTDLASQAQDMWDGLYCSPASTEPTLVATGDRVHRCLRNRFQTPPPFCDAWYDKFFGLSVAQAHELLKLSDL